MSRTDAPSVRPCACTVCRDAARFAKQTLVEISPSARVLLDMPQSTAEFLAAEQKFHGDELVRLQAAFDFAGRGKCLMAPPITLDIPALPVADEFREKIEFYRKHAMGPRMTHRRGRRIEIKKPRVPGSYIIR